MHNAHRYLRTVPLRVDARRAPARPLPTLPLALLALLALLTGLLTGCSSPNDPGEILADYNARIARVLDAELPTMSATRVPTWPAIGDIAQQPTDVRVGVFALSDVGHCGLLREIGARHSVLGRVQTPSQRLLYEMRLLRGLRHCADITGEDLASEDPARRGFATTVSQVLELKRRDLPLVYWNATFGAPEFRDFFSVGALPLRIGDVQAANNPANAIAWLAALGRLSPDAPLPASEAMEQQYYQLVGHRLGGRTWLSLDLAIRELERSTTLLELAAQEGRLCSGGRAGLREQRLRNIHRDIYLGRLQPWLDTTAAESRVLGDALEQLWQAQQITAPPALSRYRESVWLQAPGSLREDYSLAIQRHEQAWKLVLVPCGFASAE